MRSRVACSRRSASALRAFCRGVDRSRWKAAISAALTPPRAGLGDPAVDFGAVLGDRGLTRLAQVGGIQLACGALGVGIRRCEHRAAAARKSSRCRRPARPAGRRGCGPEPGRPAAEPSRLPGGALMSARPLARSGPPECGRALRLAHQGGARSTLPSASALAICALKSFSSKAPLRGSFGAADLQVGKGEARPRRTCQRSWIRRNAQPATARDALQTVLRLAVVRIGGRGGSVVQQSVVADGLESSGARAWRGAPSRAGRRPYL